jgi:hypothetical protein
MKNRKTALIIVISIIVVSIILYFLPLKKILGNFPLIKSFYNNTSIEIITEKGKAQVAINDKDYGQTPTTVENLPEGKYTIELKKIADDSTFYQKQVFEVELAKNTSARIDLEIGPENILNGTILYYTSVPHTSTGKGLVTITSSATDAKVYIDKEYIGNAPVNNLELKDNQYQVKVSAVGYEDIEIPVFVRAGYQLNLKTYHFPIPVNFDTVNN